MNRTILWSWPESWSPPSAGQDTRQTANQRDVGAQAAETGESVTRRKEQEARGIGQSAELHTSRESRYAQCRAASRIIIWAGIVTCSRHVGLLGGVSGKAG